MFIPYFASWYLVLLCRLPVWGLLLIVLVSVNRHSFLRVKFQEKQLYFFFVQSFVLGVYKAIGTQTYLFSFVNVDLEIGVKTSSHPKAQKKTSLLDKRCMLNLTHKGRNTSFTSSNTWKHTQGRTIEDTDVMSFELLMCKSVAFGNLVGVYILQSFVCCVCLHSIYLLLTAI